MRLRGCIRGAGGRRAYPRRRLAACALLPLKMDHLYMVGRRWGACSSRSRCSPPTSRPRSNTRPPAPRPPPAARAGGGDRLGGGRCGPGLATSLRSSVCGSSRCVFVVWMCVGACAHGGGTGGERMRGLRGGGRVTGATACACLVAVAALGGGGEGWGRQTIWRSFYCAIVAAITLRGIDPLHRPAPPPCSVAPQ